MSHDEPINSKISVPTPPGHWRKFVSPVVTGMASSWRHHLTEMTVLRSLSTMKNGEKWVHVSVALPSRLPDWKELTKIKNEFLGTGVSAIHVIASDDTHVNLHHFCLHLWFPLGQITTIPNLHDLALEEEA